MSDSSMAALAGLFKAQIQEQDWPSLRLYAEGLHAADVAEALQLLDSDERLALLRGLQAEQRAEVLALVSDQPREELVRSLESTELAAIVEELPADDAADLLGEMEPEDADAVLRLVNTESQEEVQQLLDYPDDSAGGIMDTDVVAVRESASRDSIVASLRERAAEETDTELSDVYVVDDRGHLVGTLPLLRVLLARNDVSMRDGIQRDVVRVNADLDQKAVAGMFAKYDLVEAPVVDAHGKLLGRITVDDVIDVMEDEASQDLARMAGTSEEDIGSRSVFRISQSRVRWLVIGMFGGLLAALIISFFQADLAQVPVAFFFVPVITAMGGNIGIQSSTVVVRALATRQIDIGQMGRQVMLEIRVALFNAALLVPVLFAVTLAWRRDVALAGVVSCSMMAVFLYAAVVGTLVPMLLAKRGIDPAIATGPFITTSNDILGVLIYLGVVSVALDWLR